MAVSLKRTKKPSHIGVIMDGNGRWAVERGLKRLEGHKRGVETVVSLLDLLLAEKIKVVSLYAFSTENWRRPRSEVTGLFTLLNEFIERELENLHKKGVRVMTSGRIEALPEKSRQLIEHAKKVTSKNKKLVANFCLNYGAQEEIVSAIKKLMKYQRLRAKPESLTFDLVRAELYTANLPDIDLLIRTAGEQRLSNFMLLQSAYAELYFTQICWPDFGEKEFKESLAEYTSRKRKFGGI